MKDQQVLAPRKDQRNGQIRWRAQYSVYLDGKRVRKTNGSFVSKKDAKAKAEEIVNEIKSKKNNEIIATDLTLMRFLKDYWYQYRYDQLINPAVLTSFIEMVKISGIGQLSVNDINKTACRRFWLRVNEYISDNNLSASWKSKIKNNMNSLLDLAVQMSYLDDNPNYATRFETGRNKMIDREVESDDLWNKAQRIWTSDQISRFLPNFNDLNIKTQTVDSIMWWAFLYIGIFTGARKGEITGLKFSDFDRDKRILTIQRSAVMDDKTRSIEIRKPKSASFGQIHYSKELDHVINALEMWHQLNETIDQDYLFQYKTGGIIDPKYWSRMFKRVQITAGVPKDEILPSVHWMRHTHLSLLAQKGYSLAEIQRRARHTDPRTTAKYYVHVIDQRDQEMAESFAEELL